MKRVQDMTSEELNLAAHKAGRAVHKKYCGEPDTRTVTFKDMQDICIHKGTQALRDLVHRDSLGFPTTHWTPWCCHFSTDQRRRTNRCCRLNCPVWLNAH